MTMKKSLILTLLVFISNISFSQNFIKGTVTDSTQTPVSYCAMALMNAKDSSQEFISNERRHTIALIT